MLSPKQLAAARLIAGNKHTIKAVAQVVGVSPRSINEWKRLPEMRAEIARLGIGWRERPKQLGIGDPDRRLAQVNDRWRRLQNIILERASSEAMQNVPGGKTGLLTVTYKMQTHTDYGGEEAVRVCELVPEYEVDTGMLAEMRVLEQHAAMDLGQWKKHVKVDAEIGPSPEAVALAEKFTPAELARIKQEMVDLLAARSL